MGVSQKTCRSLKSVFARGIRKTVRKDKQYLKKAIRMEKVCSRCHATFDWPVTLSQEGKDVFAHLDEIQKRFVCSHYVVDSICLDCLLYIQRTFYSFDIPKSYLPKELDI